MNKLEIQKRVLKNGKPLSLEKFFWCEKTRTFETKEDHLVLDFHFIDDITFKTGSDCTFKTDSDCIFSTGSNCVVIRRDIFEVIKLEKDQKIKLNGYRILGYKVIEEDKKVTIELTQSQLDKIKHLI